MDLFAMCNVFLSENIKWSSLWSVWYEHGILVFECGEYNPLTNIWQYSITLECGWKFQQWYEVVCHDNQESVVIDGFLNWQMNWLIIDEIYIIESTGEMYIGLGDVFCTSFANYDDHIGWKVRNNDLNKRWEYCGRIEVTVQWILFHKK